MASIELLRNTWGSSDGEKWNFHETQFGWAGVRTQFYNASDKDIKYITFTYVAYNAVGDVVADKDGNRTASGKLVGPIQPDLVGTVCFERLWDSDVIKTVEIAEMLVEFMDGTTESISAKELVLVCSEEAHIWDGLVDPENCYMPDISYLNPDSIFFKKHGEEIKKALELAAEEDEKLEKEMEEKHREAEKVREQNEIKKKKLIRLLIIAGAVLAVLSIAMNFLEACA